MSQTQTQTSELDSESTVSEFLRDHPRFMGALFTLLLLLSQAGTTIAKQTSTVAGP
jgi:hypothetical protein